MRIIDERKMPATLALSRSGRAPGMNFRANPDEKRLFDCAKRPFCKFVGTRVSKLPKTTPMEVPRLTGRLPVVCVRAPKNALCRALAERLKFFRV